MSFSFSFDPQQRRVHGGRVRASQSESEQKSERGRSAGDFDEGSRRVKLGAHETESTGVVAAAAANGESCFIPWLSGGEGSDWSPSSPVFRATDESPTSLETTPR